jgi:hypothetical protein
LATDYFGFTFRLRPGWEVVPEQVRKGFVSDLHASSPEADNRALLMLFRPTHGAIIPDVIVVASARYPRTSRTSVNEALAKLRRDRHSDLALVVGEKSSLHQQPGSE